MTFRVFKRCILGLAATAVLASIGCGGSEAVSPSTNPPAAIAALSDLNRTATVGTVVPSGLTVKVTDASGRPVAGVNVAFAVTGGNGSTNPRLAVTDANGQATTAWTLGTIAGPNQVTATVNGVSTQVTFQATGNAGAVTTISLSTASTRLLVGTDTSRLTAKALDSFGNSTDASLTFTVRDPSLVTIDNNGLIRALRRGSSTYIVASASGKTDSALVTVLATGQSICTGAATPVTLTVGQVVTDVSGNGFCVHGSADSAEYAIIPFFNAAVSSATIPVEVRPNGISPILFRTTAFDRKPALTSFTTLPMPNDAAEMARREQERTESVARFAKASNWLSARRDLVRSNAAAAAVPTVPAIGDLLKFNTDANYFCDSLAYRYGRVVAVTDRAIVVADTSNPAGGFTGDEYKSLGVSFDTLVDPLDRKMFGDPSDIDNNGHVIMFFTSAVNKLTTQGAPNGVYLGFFYARDLFPKEGPLGTCPGTNFGEMFYLLVPDPTGSVNGNIQRKPDVVSYTLGTVAHEYQHLINASRRLYVNKFGPVFEEHWLDEGLAHIAEDVNFWNSSKMTTRSNIAITKFKTANDTAAYNTFANFNIRRYTQYLGRTETQGPVGFDENDSDLYTRGAIWSFLRYAADRLFPTNEQPFWYGLVNNNSTGLTNLTTALGTAPGPLLRDWAISVFMDDNAPGVDPRFTQPSYNFRDILTAGGTGVPFPLVTRLLTDGRTSSVTLSAYSASYMRFSVLNGQEALLTATSGGQTLPSSVQLAVVRVR